MKFLCDNCKAKYQIADEKVAGKTVRMKCRKCGHQIEVRAAITETSVTSAPPRSSQPPRPPQKPSSLATSLSAAKPRAPTPPQQGGALAGAFQRQVQEVPKSMPPPPQAVAVGLSVNDEWYVAINGVPVGPVRLTELRRKAGSGAVTEESLCWQEGLEEWRPIRSIPELATLVREAIQGNRPSVVGSEPPRNGPQPPRPPAPRSVAPSPPAPRAEPLKRSEPPRAPEPPLRNNVVPLHGRGVSAPTIDPLGGGAAAARAPSASRMPSAAPIVASAPSIDPFAISPMAPPTPAPPPPAPATAYDPFGLPAAAPMPTPTAPPAPPQPALAPMTSTPSIPPGYLPADQGRRGVPLWFWPILLVALGFGGTIAFLVFRPQPQPAPVVIQMPPTPTPTAEKTVEVDDTPPAPTDSVATTTTPKKPTGGPRPAAPPPPTTERKAADISGLLGGSGAGPTPGGPGGPGPSGGGSFDQAAVERVVAGHRAGVKRTCWERVSGPDQKASVNVTVNATVAPNGSVSNTSSTGDDPVVAKCIENQVRTWRFPAPGESRQIALPFKFVRQ